MTVTFEGFAMLAPTVQPGSSVGRDLVIVSVPGVQRFISESRTTRDLVHSSQIIVTLCRSIINSLKYCPGAELILPAEEEALTSDQSESIPNKVVFSAEAGRGAEVARDLCNKAHEWWEQQVRKRVSSLSFPQNFPIVQWVCVSAQDRTYAEQWDLATSTLAARRRIRDFVPLNEPSGRALCSMTGRWTALDQPPSGTPPHEREERLSSIAWVKRHWLNEEVPSTSAIATAPLRAWIADNLDNDVIRQCVTELKECASKAFPSVSGRGFPLLSSSPSSSSDDPLRSWILKAAQWVQVEAWTSASIEEARLDDSREWGDDAKSLAQEGQRAARRLQEEVVKAGGPPAARYLALVVQDLDDMGKKLSSKGCVREVTPEWHRTLSRQMKTVAQAQRRALESPDLLGKVIYAGGDDLLTFVPASTALAAARKAHEIVTQENDLPTASTAVFFFHQHSSLSDAIRRAQELLTEAKNIPGKHALAVGFERRSGNSYSLIRPWKKPETRSFVDLLETLQATRQFSVTPGLLDDLRRDREELESLIRSNVGVFRAELRRLVKRHIMASKEEIPLASVIDDWSDALATIAPELGKDHLDVVGAMRIGLFLLQECR